MLPAVTRSASREDNRVQVSIAALSHEHTPSVRECNIRLAAHGVLYHFPASPVPNWLP